MLFYFVLRKAPHCFCISPQNGLPFHARGVDILDSSGYNLRVMESVVCWHCKQSVYAERKGREIVCPACRKVMACIFGPEAGLCV